MESQRLHRVESLIASVGIDVESFVTFLEWTLTEQLVGVMADEVTESDFFARKDALKLFRDRLRWKTGRDWSTNDLNRLFDAARQRKQVHFRGKIEYGDLLKILWNLPHRCAQCGATPPAIKLHIDHVYPASLGGSSKALNLQFLCAKHNLIKSNKLTKGNLWLDLQ